MNQSINPLQLYDLVKQHALIIDLRDHYLYQKQHIQNSINIPFQDFEKTSLNPQTPTYFLCQSGQIAKQLSLQLNKEGYHTAYINGGIQAFLSLPPHHYY